MKAYLLFRDRDFDLQQSLPPNEEALTQDLELATLLDAMAAGDEFLLKVAKQAVLSSLVDLDAILYRQAILDDCLKNSSVVRDMYGIAVEALQKERKNYWGISTRDYPEWILRRSTDVMRMFVDMLRKLRGVADEHAHEFGSEGFARFFAMLTAELSDEYFAVVENHVKALQFRDGVLVSAELGQGNKGTNFVLRRSELKLSWLDQLLGKGPPAYTFTIADRDENGAKALGELRDRGIDLAANALAQSNDHILGFFVMLRTELAFYVGCLNLHEQLARKGMPTCFPAPVAPGERRHTFAGLYDVSLALTTDQHVVGNEVNADDKDLVMITGANQGGKSTFLRSIGLAQLMMQCGMFVPAESFSSNVCDGLFTHYKREEDVTMKSGKFDEELSRMSDIVDHVRPNSLVLFNESFAATNEREGSEIAGQIVRALLEKRIKVFFVTHMFELAHGFFERQMPDAIYLRAERQADGRRTFKLLEGEPLQTSYGLDLYDQVFGKDNGHLPTRPEWGIFTRAFP
jgi:hypothetical protein